MDPAVGYAFAIIFVLIGLVGMLLPALPGVPMVFAGLLLAAWSGGFQHIGGVTIFILALLTLFAAIVDITASAFGTRIAGASRWAFLKEVRQFFPNRTLLGSGDLFTAADCVRMLRETCVDGVTAARGSIGNPWIFSQAAALLRGEPMPQPPTVDEQRDVICEHFRLAEQILPPDQVSKQLRKFCIHYSAWHPAADTVRAAFIAVRNAADWHQVIACHYAIDQPGQYPADPGNSGQPLEVSCAEPAS